jgi:hypothetical protein
MFKQFDLSFCHRFAMFQILSISRFVENEIQKEKPYEP